jgi:hypothetical protein
MNNRGWIRWFNVSLTSCEMPTSLIRFEKRQPWPSSWISIHLSSTSFPLMSIYEDIRLASYVRKGSHFGVVKQMESGQSSLFSNEISSFCRCPHLSLPWVLCYIVYAPLNFETREMGAQQRQCNPLSNTGPYRILWVFITTEHSMSPNCIFNEGFVTVGMHVAECNYHVGKFSSSYHI